MYGMFCFAFITGEHHSISVNECKYYFVYNTRALSQGHAGENIRDIQIIELRVPTAVMSHDNDP